MDYIQTRPTYRVPVTEVGLIEGVSQSEVDMFIRQTRRPYEEHIQRVQVGWEGAYNALCVIAGLLDGSPGPRDKVDVSAILDAITKLQKGAQETPPVPLCGSELLTPGRAWVCDKSGQHIVIGDPWHEDARGNKWQVSSPLPTGLKVVDAHTDVHGRVDAELRDKM